MFVGSCFAEALKHDIQNLSKVPHDYVQYGPQSKLNEILTRPVSDYDYAGISIALRFLIPESAYSRISFDDEKAFEALFEAAVRNMIVTLEGALAFCAENNLLALVCDFLAPHQNPK